MVDSTLAAAGKVSANWDHLYDCKGKFGFVYRVVGTDEHQLSDSTARVVGRSHPTPSPNRQQEHVQSQASPQRLEVGNQTGHWSSQGQGHLPSPAQGHLPNHGPSQGHLPNSSQCHLPSPGLIPNPGHLPSQACLSSSVVDSSGFSVDSVMESTSITDSDIEKEVEIRKFAADLRKLCIIYQSGKETSTGDVDSAIELLVQDLRKSDVYYRYLQSEDPELPTPSSSPSPISMSHELKERIGLLRATIKHYKHELKEWDEVIEQKTLGVEDAKRTFESERDVDFRQLHCDDVETLKSYLTPEQSSLLEKPLLGNPQFRLEAEKQLDAINSKLEAELKRIQSHCHHTNSHLRLGSNLDMSVIEDTPRTLFRALKHHS